MNTIEVDQCQIGNQITQIPDELVCPLCEDLLTEAIMLPCCAVSTCDACAKSYLCKSLDERGQMICPLEECSSQDISIEDLIPNRRLRQKSMSLRNKFPDILQDKECRLRLIVRRQKSKLFNNSIGSNEIDSIELTTSSMNYDKNINEADKSSNLFDSKKISPISAELNKQTETENIEKTISVASIPETKTGNPKSVQYTPCNDKHIIVRSNIADCEKSISKEQSISMSVSYDLTNKDMIDDSKMAPKADLILTKKQIDIDFDDSSLSEAPNLGEESSNNLSKRNSDCNNGNDKVKQSISPQLKNEIENDNAQSQIRIALPEKSEVLPNSHKITIPAHYLDEAIDDPLAAFNKLMAVKDKEKGIMDSFEHYGLPRNYKSSWSPERNHAYYDYRLEHPMDYKRNYSYRYPHDSSSRYERKPYSHIRCYKCDRIGHAAIECRERYSPRRYRYDYSRYYHERKSYEERIQRDEIHSMKTKLEKRKRSPETEDKPSKKQRKRSLSPHPTSTTEEHAKSHSSVENEQPSSPAPKAKKNKHKSKRDISPDVKKEAKKKSKKEVKEISTFVEVNAQFHERCTKRKEKRKKSTYSSDHRHASDLNVSKEDEPEPEQEKQSKKKSLRALELLDEEIRGIMKKRYQKQEKGLVQEKVKQKEMPNEKEKMSKKDKPDKKGSSKPLKKKMKSKHSSKRKYESIARKKEQRKVEKRERRKYD